MGQLIATLEERKDRLIEMLSTQYSLNIISVEEYERLIKYSQDIETDKELQIFEKIIQEHNAAETPKESVKDDNRRMSNKIPQNHFTILSSRRTTGPMTSGNFTTILGDHKIIIDEEDLLNEKTVINLKVLLGDVVIHVPENVKVISKVFPLLAGVSVADGLKNKSSQKKLIIKGSVLLGDVKVKIRK